MNLASLLLMKSITFPERHNNDSPCRSPSEKNRRPCASALEKARLGGSGGSVDSRSGSASPDRGFSSRGSFLHRANSDRSSVERLRITTGRLSKDATDHDKERTDVIGDSDVRGDDDEPPGPAPSSRPHSPTGSHGK